MATVAPVNAAAGLSKCKVHSHAYRRGQKIDSTNRSWITTWATPAMCASMHTLHACGLQANDTCASSARTGMISAISTVSWSQSGCHVVPDRRSKKAQVVSQPVIEEVSKEVAVEELTGGVVRECGGSSGQACNHKHKQLCCIANYEDILLQLATTVDSNLTQTQDSSPDDREPSMIPLKKVIDLREPKRRLGQKSRADYEA